MLITRIELENIKSYRHQVVDFRRGTTAISGKNGAGKTTLVEAIGYALFNYLPYNQSQFVREGEKSGKIVVHLIGNDDRPYEVERRCGSGAQWMVYDREADLRVEQRTDVLDKLHELFGIDRDRPLDILFRDALGVPQGTFTSIFLEAANRRKQTFEALLQIEDYKTASDYLLEVRKQYEEQIQEQKNCIQRLEIETRDLEEWQRQLKQARQDDAQKKLLNEQLNRRLIENQERSAYLAERRERLKSSESAYRQQQTVSGAARQLLESSERALYDARAAQQAMQQSETDFTRFQQTDALLKDLRLQERRRNALLQQASDLSNKLATTQANIHNWLERLQEVDDARKQVVTLLPAIEQQNELEKQRDLLIQQVRQYDELVKDIQRLDAQQVKVQQELAKVQQRIAAIEPLQASAQLLNARQQRLTELKVTQATLSTKSTLLGERTKELKKRADEQEQAAARLRYEEDTISKLEKNRAKVEELPALQVQFDELTAQMHRLEGNIAGYKKSRTLSAGGQCPLLHEPCQNIKARGLISLEFYFDAETKRDAEQLDGLHAQHATGAERIAVVKRYADEMSQLGRHIELRDSQVERLEQIAQDIPRLEREIASIQAELQEYKHIGQHIAQANAELEESKQADAQVRMLDGLQQQERQGREQIEQVRGDIQERSQRIETLRDSKGQLEQLERELEMLNDPRSESRALQSIIQREDEYTRQLQLEQDKQGEMEQARAALQQQLAQYAGLDGQIGEQEGIRQLCQAGHTTYLKNQDIARQLPEREQAYHEASGNAARAEQELEAALEAYTQAQAVYNAGEEQEVNQHITSLQKEISAIARDLNVLQDRINELTGKIEYAETQRLELKAAEEEKQVLEDLQSTLLYFRNRIKEAAPTVTKAILSDISGEANRIFCEIMGDRSAHLSWENDYEIMLRRQSTNRTFAQLSGGEQMSAALAIRLALLKKLSTLNIAFFDEPTQNMDDLRRSNLAEQIKRVRGFDQLIVISHDDTFEQGLDSLIRLQKRDLETRILDEDEVSTVKEQVTVHAS